MKVNYGVGWGQDNHRTYISHLPTQPSLCSWSALPLMFTYPVSYMFIHLAFTSGPSQFLFFPGRHLHLLSVLLAALHLIPSGFVPLHLGSFTPVPFPVVVPHTCPLTPVPPRMSPEHLALFSSHLSFHMSPPNYTTHRPRMCVCRQYTSSSSFPLKSKLFLSV